MDDETESLMNIASQFDKEAWLDSFKLVLLSRVSAESEVTIQDVEDVVTVMRDVITAILHHRFYFS